jgi:hypothetical protein
MTVTNVAANVHVGKPDATGGVYAGPVGTALPITTAAALNVAFGGLGYVSEDGLTMTKGGDMTVLRAWGGEPVKIVKTTDDLTFAWTFIECSDTVMAEIFGSDNVTVGVDDTTIELNGSQVGPRAWVFEIIDGAFSFRVVVPNAELTGEVSVTFVDGQPISWPATITALPDSSGNKAYIYKTADA